MLDDHLLRWKNLFCIIYETKVFIFNFIKLIKQINNDMKEKTPKYPPRIILIESSGNDHIVIGLYNDIGYMSIKPYSDISWPTRNSLTKKIKELIKFHSKQRHHKSFFQDFILTIVCRENLQ